MKEELQGKLVEILTSIQTAAGKASDFAMEQLPDIALQYVMYGRAINTLYVIVGLVLLAVLLWLLPRAVKAINEAEVWPIPVYMFGGSTCAAILLSSIGPAMLVWFAPKVWLLKEIAGLLK